MNVKPEVMHLMILDKCDKDCKYCCNKLYDIDKIPVATVEELKQVHTVCITGGEPFFSDIDISSLALYIKGSYPNVKSVYVYTSGMALSAKVQHIAPFLDGINIAPKSAVDWRCLEMIAEHYDHAKKVAALKSNRLYVFRDQIPMFNKHKSVAEKLNLEVIYRKWDKKFNTPSNEIFRRVPIFI